MKIIIGNDHASVDMKNDIIKYLESKGHTLINVGTDTNDACDYPDYAKIVCDKVLNGEGEFGILICGTGIGMSIAANKIKGIRAALCCDPLSAKLTKEHNNSNIITFGSRIIGLEIAKSIVDNFMDAKFLSNRHQTRIDKVAALES